MASYLNGGYILMKSMLRGHRRITHKVTLGFLTALAHVIESGNVESVR
jgi:hypothetical protein